MKYLFNKSRFELKLAEMDDQNKKIDDDLPLDT